MGMAWSNKKTIEGNMTLKKTRAD